MRFAAGLMFFLAFALAAPANAQPAAAGESVAELSHEQLVRRYVEFGGAEAMYIEASVYGFRKGA